MFSRLLYRIFLFLARNPGVAKLIKYVLPLGLFLYLFGPGIYEGYRANLGDTSEDRGAVAMTDSRTGENYSTPVYIYAVGEKKRSQQGWRNVDSLWFYNTSQGSNLLPYDFFMALEQANSDKAFISARNMDKYRYLPQKETPFNPDALPVGLVKDTYRGRQHWYDLFKPKKKYIGFTCAACHTGQVNYKNLENPSEPDIAIRIDGGPAMSDMVGFMTGLEKALYAAKDGKKGEKFVADVLAREKSDYKTEEQVKTDLDKWTAVIAGYNQINGSDVEYGHGRLDAFGRIYNRALQYVISTDQAKQVLGRALRDDDTAILSDAQLTALFTGVEGSPILGDEQFTRILQRMNGLGLSPKDLLALRDSVFNAADAPVSYPFLWDTVQSDYVQWNGLAGNGGIGPLGRNTGEVIGVFGNLKWKVRKKSFLSKVPLLNKIPFIGLSAKATGQNDKATHITFDSSINLTNLRRLESKLTSLKSPVWPQELLGKIDETKTEKGQRLYAKYCESCHEVVDRASKERIIVGKMSSIESVGTDPKMAMNSVMYKGQSGNLYATYQEVDGVGNVVIEKQAPVVQVLTSEARGVITTPDRDKLFLRRWVDRITSIILAIKENRIKNSVKVGDYKPDTTAGPYDSLLSYKARSLNGIWATAPYLHNGSVPTLYDLLLPCKAAMSEITETENVVTEIRPKTFEVGSRMFDAENVGFETSNGVGRVFDTSLLGNSNCGHEYGAGQNAGDNLDPLTESQRRDLVEYLKTL